MRVFYALWPDPPAAVALAGVARRMQRIVGGRLVREENIHLTLAFLGEVEASAVAALADRNPEFPARKFVLRLDRWGCWPRSEVGWAGTSVVPDGLRGLMLGLNARLLAGGFAADEREYRAHVTLVRKAQCAPITESMPPVSWLAAEFVLVESRLVTGGPEYRILGRWPLD